MAYWCTSASSFVPRLGIQTVSDYLLEECQIISHAIEQTLVTSGVVCFEVESQLRGPAIGMQPQLEVDGGLIVEKPDERPLLASAKAA